MAELSIGTEDSAGFDAPVAIDLDGYEEQGLRVGIFAASGSGKGWLLGVLLEEFIGLGYPVIAIDPESELWTFQEVGALVLGGPHGDVPLPRSDDGVRKAIEFGVSFHTPIIFDLGGITGGAALLREGERISGILWQYADEVRQRIVFAVTEAEVFAPQTVPTRGVQPEILATITKRGRKRGMITLLETQRPADIANAVITQCNVRLIGRMDDTADYDRVKRYVTPTTFTEMHRLPTGTFMLDGLPVQVRARRVTHGGGTPIGGEITIAAHPTPKGLAEIIAALREPDPVPARIGLPEDLGHSEMIVTVPGTALVAAEQRAARAEAGLAQALTDVQVSGARIASLERQVTDARPLAEVAAQLRKALLALVGEQIVTAQINMPDGSTFHGNQGLGEEDIIDLIRRHAPTGGAGAPALLPVEALRTRYLEATAQRLVETVEGLDPDEREALLFLVGQGTFQTTNAVSKALSHSDSGGVRERWGKALHSLTAKGLVEVGGSGKMGRRERIAAWVASTLGPHSPTDAEVEQVKNRALSVVMSR